MVLAQWERRVTGKALQPEGALIGRIQGRALLEQLPESICSLLYLEHIKGQAVCSLQLH